MALFPMNIVGGGGTVLESGENTLNISQNTLTYPTFQVNTDASEGGSFFYREKSISSSPVTRLSHAFQSYTGTTVTFIANGSNASGTIVIEWCIVKV